jgi:alanine dehydrogenase
MRVGVPREVKVEEHRVGLTPAAAGELAHRGHTVLVERGAGEGIGADDEAYRQAGATVVAAAAEVFDAADLVVKVKEPQPEERKRLRPGQVLFTYLHLAPDPAQARDLIESGAIYIAYETVTGPDGGLPLLAPMSEVAGRMAVQAGAHYLEKPQGGKGLLLGGVPGVAPGRVTILGGGVVGTHAVEIARGLGADVAVLDRSAAALRRLWAQFGPRLHTVHATRESIARYVRAADLVVGGVLVPGASAPRLVDAATIAAMEPGSVVVDVAIDQGGCIETSHPTTHAAPTYVAGGVVHYCVANMPGAVPRTSTYALNNATLPFVIELADRGWRAALEADAHLRAGLNVALGKVTCAPVAEALGYAWTPPEAVLQAA